MSLIAIRMSMDVLRSYKVRTMGTWKYWNELHYCKRLVTCILSVYAISPIAMRYARKDVHSYLGVPKLLADRLNQSTTILLEDTKSPTLVVIFGQSQITTPLPHPRPLDTSASRPQKSEPPNYPTMLNSKPHG
jgi:hypothetical protein